jgi:predicted permease
MSWIQRLLGRGRAEADLDRELRDHLERRVADLVAAGVPHAEAGRRAALEFGGVEGVKEECRDARGTRWVHDLAQDVRYGARQLAQAPVFAVVAVLSLALGIGANATIFSLVNGLLLRTLPVEEPSRLVMLDHGSWTNPIWEQMRAHRARFSQNAAAYGSERFDLAQGGQSQFVDGLYASGSYFETLGVEAALGRTFTERDDQRGGGPDGPVAVISHRFWQQHFAGAVDVVGRSITLNRKPFTVIGVLPQGFHGPAIGRSYDVTVPIGTIELFKDGPESALDGRSHWWLEIVARLKPGETPDDATRGLRAVQPQIRAATLPDRWPAEALPRYLKDGLTFESAAAGPTYLQHQFRTPLVTLMVVVGIVLLVACANIANLLLARATTRRHELAMRRALGASAGRLFRQLLAESLLLSSAGALLGLLFAQWGSRLLTAQLSTFREVVALDTPLDWRVLAFTAGVAVATALVFGTAPALSASRVDPNDALKEQGRSLAGERRRGLSAPLVVVQVALSLVLVVAAGLFVRTFAVLATMDPGFERQGLWLAEIDARRSTTRLEDRTALFERVRQAVTAVPGVKGASLSALTPLSNMGWNTAISMPHLQSMPEDERTVWFNALSPRFFETYQTRVVAGREFTPADRKGAPLVAVVNEAFARKYLEGRRAIGAVIDVYPDKPGDPWPKYEIVGVVEDAAYRSLREPKPPTVYLSLMQSQDPFIVGSTNLSVRAAGAGITPAALTRGIVDAVARIDRSLSLTVRPLADQVNEQLINERIIAALSGFFGGLALLIAGIGLYGITAYAVGRRRTEIGIRMALGADGGRVLRLVLGRVGRLVAAGTALGILLSVWASRFVASLLYGIEGRDVVTLATATATLAVVAAVAAWLPARRAARIDPATVLREG